jgi:tetratricopeptide (TPR) repeat protein
MTNIDDKAVISTSSLQEAWAMLVRLVGTIAGAASLTFGIGFVLVNLSLLKHGIYEGALVRERYVGAGISFVALLAGAALIALAAYSLARRLLNRWPRGIRLLMAVVLAAGLDYMLALAVWSFKGSRFFSWALLIWTFVGGWLGLFLLYADRIPQAREFFFRQAPLPTSRPQSPVSPTHQTGAPARTTREAGVVIPQILGRVQSPAYLTALGIMSFALLLTYGQYVYDTLPAALGGGQPVVVQFTGSEQNGAILAEMGIPLESPTTTGQLELIGQTGSRYIVFVREINWEESLKTGEMRVISRRTALAFDKGLVQGVRYYPSEYYLSDEFAAVTHIQQGDELSAQEFCDAAIREYTVAIGRQPDCHLAYFKRGQVYLIKARSTPAQRDDFAKQAVSDFDRARGLNRGEAPYWYHLALAQTLAREYRTAVETLREAINRELAYRDQAQVDPLFDELKARAHLDFSFEVLLFDNVMEAARAYAADGQDQYAIAQETEEAQVQGETLIQATLAYSRAITLISAANLPLEQADYRIALATIYQDRELPDLAMIQLQQAVGTAPDNEGYRLRLARTYAEQFLWLDAQHEYEAVLERNDQNVTALLGKGEALLQRADHRQAAGAFQRASDLAPEEVTAWYGLCVAQLAFAPSEAEAPLRQVVTLDPTYAISISQALQQAELETNVRQRLEVMLRAAEAVVRGDACLEVGDLAQAIDEYGTATEHDPDNLVYLVKLGDAYRKQGDAGAMEAYAQAADIYRRLIKQVEDEPSYHFRLATVYAAQGEDAAALDAYDTAIKLAPDVAAYYATRALLYIQLGRSGDAIADFEQAISLETGNHLHYGRLGQLYYAQAQYDEAIANLTTATGLNPQYAPGFYYLGLAHLAAGDADAARIAFAKCTEVTQDEIQQRQCQEQLIPLVTPTP